MLMHNKFCGVLRIHFMNRKHVVNRNEYTSKLQTDSIWAAHYEYDIRHSSQFRMHSIASKSIEVAPHFIKLCEHTHNHLIE